MVYDFTVIVEQDEDSVFVGSIPSLDGCYADGDTYEEMMQNLMEVAKLCVRNQDNVSPHKFVKTEHLSLAV
jgi:predicted RNase H-like HicB family nuclease